MGKYIITRTNTKVTQVWEDNDASWSFFIAHMSRDVSWRNRDGKERPKRFESFWHAKKYLDERAKRLGPSERKHEPEWEYHIAEEVDPDGVYHTPMPGKRETDAV